MKRSELIDHIVSLVYAETCADFIMDTDEAERVLTRLEALGIRLVDSDGQETPYEPEEGWDKWLELQDAQDQKRDFRVVNFLTERTASIAQQFLHGASFEQLASQHNVTRERIRQIVAKARRAYQKENNE